VHVRRLLPLGALTAVLLAAAGIASHGRPFSGSRGGGPTTQFFDYLLTTLAVLAIAVFLVVAYALLAAKPAGDMPAAPPRRTSFLVSFLLVVAASLFAWYVVHAHLYRHLSAANEPTSAPHTKGRPQAGPPAPTARKHVRLQWDEFVIAAVLLGGVFVGVLVTSRRRQIRPVWSLPPRDTVSAALDESLDDLRSEPDLRKAIVAAYARMEAALGSVGIRRHPSEAPFEYLGRALTSLDASAPASRRLTDLFEWAKFSQHDPEPAMRDEAIDALVAVRDELRHPTAVAA